MGGFIVDVHKADATYISYTITPLGVLNFARKGHFLVIEESQISDRSKADILAKVLVCLQVSWMLIQCIARKSVGYPLTILELHTFVHVGCALMMFVLWFKVSVPFHVFPIWSCVLMNSQIRNH